MSQQEIHKALQKLADPQRAKTNAKFFKDHHIQDEKFIGVRVPDIRKIVEHEDATLKDAEQLLNSKIHEEKVAGALAFVKLYKQAQNFKEKQRVYERYLKNIKKLTNWDLVDLSTPYIIGQHILDGNNSNILHILIKSKNHWERRAAMVANWMLLRKAQDDSHVYEMAERVMSDPEDLMHKATGWMLREAGKIDTAKLLTFYNKNYLKMPSVMRRYALEKIPDTQRKKLLYKARYDKKNIPHHS